MPIEPKEIASPKPKSMLTLAGIIAAVGAASLASTGEPKWEAWALIAFAALVALADLYFRKQPPLVLTLDADGFAFWGKCQKTLWRETDGFSVMELPRLRFVDQLKVVTVKFKPGVVKPSAMAAINDLVGADACIPMIWPRPHEAIAEELNDYRRSALAAQCDRLNEASPDLGTSGPH